MMKRGVSADGMSILALGVAHAIQGYLGGLTSVWGGVGVRSNICGCHDNVPCLQLLIAQHCETTSTRVNLWTLSVKQQLAAKPTQPFSCDDFSFGISSRFDAPGVWCSACRNIKPRSTCSYFPSPAAICLLANRLTSVNATPHRNCRSKGTCTVCCNSTSTPRPSTW